VVASNGITFKPSFVKIGQLNQKLEGGTRIHSIVITDHLSSGDISGSHGDEYDDDNLVGKSATVSLKLTDITDVLLR
jgi:hypothetical protein